MSATQLEERARSRDLWNVKEAADLLRCKPCTIRLRVKQGELDAIRPAGAIQIPAESLVNYLRKRAS